MASKESMPMVPLEDGQELLDELQKDFDRKKKQKSRPTGGVEGSTLEHLCMLNDEQYVTYKKGTLSLEPRDENKLYLTFNLIGPRMAKLMGRLSAFNAPFKARPNRKDPQALEQAEIVDRMVVALDEKLDEPSRMRERLYWMLVSGTAFEHVPWVPNATIEPEAQFDESGELLFKNLQDPDPESPPVPQSVMEQMVAAGTPPEAFQIHEEVQLVGEVGGDIYGPFNVFVDSNIRSIADIPPDDWAHVAGIKTLGWVKENFGELADDVEKAKEVSLIGSRIKAEGESTGGVYLKDLIPLVQGSQDANDPPMVLVIQSYQPASTQRPHGRYVCWIPGQKVLHDADNPYDEIPIVDFHFSPVTTNFWTKSYIAPLVAPQRFINKRMSQLGEQANATIYSSLLLGAGLKESDIPADFPGSISGGLGESGEKLVQRLDPPQIPTWFLQSIELAVKMFNDAAGGADLMEDNKFPGQLRGPMAVPMLQEIMDTQWGPLFQHLGERLARVKQMRLNRVKQFYPPSRTMHYTDKTQKDEVLEFHTDKILRSGTNFHVTVERGAILPELRSLREARGSERLAGPLAVLYMDERTGRIDKSKVAADLQFGDTGREGRESAHRKLAIEIIKMMWEAQPLPPVQPFYDHTVFLDELEAAMTTTEFMKASPPIQMVFSQRWSEHNAYLQQQAMAQMQAQQSQQIQSAVAQATQQAAAMAAAQAVDSAMAQTQAQKSLPTEQYVSDAQAQSGGRPNSKPEKPAPKKRKLTVEESS